jgi:pimeloyl-ACP methyl ester carboxylesterase
MRKLMTGLSFTALATCGAADVPAQIPAQTPSVIEVVRSGNADGRTVLLIPGLASSADVWDATRPLLEADYDVRTVQVAGFAGASPIEVDGPYTDAIAGALIAELQETAGNDVVLVGHSMGGFVSMKAALVAPDLIDELVIVDSVPFLAGLFFPGATPEMAAAQAPIMASQMAGMPRDAFDAQQKAGLGRLVKTQDALPAIARWGETSDQAMVASTMGEMIAADLRADLANMQTKALIMMPFDDAMGLPRAQIEQTYKDQYAAAPNASIEVFENSFHFIMIDQKDAFHNSLLRALSD